MDSALAALRRVDFNWTAHLDEIWSEQRYETSRLQAEIRQELEDRVADLAMQDATTSPLGIPMLGAAGSGKTHLLGVIRRRALSQGAYFVLADMTDVGDFWETVSLGYLRSLQQRTSGGRRQVDLWLDAMIRHFGKGEHKMEGIPKQRPPGLINRTEKLIAQVRSKHPAETQEHTDVMRAMVLFACDHADINDLGYKWLQGLEIDQDELVAFGFRQSGQKSSRIVRGLSWLLSLTGSTVLALDQLDAIVAEHELARGAGSKEVAEEEHTPPPQQQQSMKIIQGIARGLLDLRDVTRRTLTVVSSLEATWDILDRQAPVSMVDRYDEKLLLKPSSGIEVYRELVSNRLHAAYEQQDFKAPYPSYPYTDAFFEYYKRNTPRELLKACEAHRKACRRAQAVTETVTEIGVRVISGNSESRPDDDGWKAAITAELRKRASECDPRSILSDESERLQDRLIEAACDALVIENPVPGSVLAKVDKDFMGTGSYDPLNARIRLMYTEEREREKHHSFRFLEKEHYRAFQARLKAALTASGIDNKLSFRGLTILRRAEMPGGAATQKLLQELVERGGHVVSPADDDLSSLMAIESLIREEVDRLDDWLAQERPVSKMPCFARAVETLFPQGAQVKPGEVAEPEGKNSSGVPSAEDTGSSSGEGVQSGAAGGVVSTASRVPLTIGWRQREPQEEVGIPLDMLPYHTCVLAGSGSGKTVFLKRVIEEAALRGIPSIVLDGANDLSRLGTSWPARPDAFTEPDDRKAKRYREQSDVVVWTPGAANGNPMCLNPLPEFESPAALPELERQAHVDAAIEIAASSITEMIVRGGAKASRQKAIVKGALRYFARRGGSLHDFAAFLQEPPDDVIDPYEKGEKMARELSELLYAEIENDPLLGNAGQPLDPQVLFRAGSPGKTRVSVINLVGLPGYAQKRRFVDQLASTLFCWIKKNPAPPGGLLGLLVIDEAKDFVPAGKNVPGKENIQRLAAQARKYGLGLLFATQEPKSIDHKVVANCSTLLGGRMNSPAAIDALQGLLSEKGTYAKDIASLNAGEFYFSTGSDKPRKIKTSLCLSYHPSTPPSESQVLEYARQSAARQSA